MMDIIPISAPTQGADAITAKAQAKGGKTGFLGMLMTAIGHQAKGKKDKGIQSAIPQLEGKAAKAMVKAADLAMSAQGHGKSKTGTTPLKNSGHADKAATNHKNAHTKHGTADTADSNSEFVAGSPVSAAPVTATKPQDITAKGSAKQPAGAHPQGHRLQNESGTAAVGAAIAAMPQVAHPATPLSQVDERNGQSAQTAKATDTRTLGSNAQVHPELVGSKSIGKAAAAQQSADATSMSPSSPTEMESPKEAAMNMKATAASDTKAPSAKGAQAHQSAPQMRQDSALPITADALSGKQNVATAAQAPAGEAATTAKKSQPVAAADQGYGNGQPETSTGAIPIDHASDQGPPLTHANAKIVATAGENLAASMPRYQARGKTQARHAPAADTHVSHAQASDTPASGTTGTPTGIRSYGRIVADTHGHAGPSSPLPTGSKAVPLHHHAGPAPMGAGTPNLQNAAGGDTPPMAATGAIPGTQAVANLHATTPSPVHSSGPWTVMAAMQEIGQAALNGHSRLELKLEPAHLGKVHVRIDSDANKNIQVHLVVEQASSRQAIEQQLPNLRHALAQQGLNLGNFSMSSQQQGAGNGYAPDQQSQQAISMPIPAHNEAITPPPVNAASVLPGTGRLSIRI